MESDNLANDFIIKLHKYSDDGFALYDFKIFQLVYKNKLFESWFSNNFQKNKLNEHFTSIDMDRLENRLAKNRPYSISLEILYKNRKNVIKLSFSTIDDFDQKMILVKASNITKEIEMEHMIDSYATLAEKNRKELERANQSIKEKNKRMSEELEIARKVQLGMLPFNFNPLNDNIEIAAFLKPAKEVGGDFFDIFYVAENKLCICLGDVSDKGAGPALFMAATKTILKSNSVTNTPVATIVSRANNELSKNNDRCMFATLFIGIFNLENGELEYSNCGHCRPILFDEDNLVTLEGMNGPPLGIVEDFSYTSQKIKIKKSQSLLVYSDGVSEAINANDELYGEDKLEKLILDCDKNKSGEQMVNLIFESVNQFEGETSQSDDITLLTIKYFGEDK